MPLCIQLSCTCANMTCYVFYFFFSLSTEVETELNVEVAFSEQALTYRDNHQLLKVNTCSNSADDKLPVRHAHTSPHHIAHTLFSLSILSSKQVVLSYNLWRVSVFFFLKKCMVGFYSSLFLQFIIEGLMLWGSVGGADHLSTGRQDT